MYSVKGRSCFNSQCKSVKVTVIAWQLFPIGTIKTECGVSLRHIVSLNPLASVLSPVPAGAPSLCLVEYFPDRS